MNLLSLLLLIAALPCAALAKPNQPKIEVLKFSWRKLPPHKSAADKQAEEKRNELIEASIRGEYLQDHPDLGKIRALEAMKTQPNTIEDPSASDKAYVYMFSLRNTGSLEIVRLKWAYVFKDAATKNELVRHSFESKVKVLPHHRKEVILYTDSGPPKVVNSAVLRKGSRVWDEAVIIEAVEYADGSRWVRE